MYRTHDCNALRKPDIGKQVTLAGWVHVSRDHGGVIFIDLRDREGLTQVVFRPEENAEVAKQAHHLRSEDVIQVSGRVAARVPDTENPKLATGDIELVPSELKILNRADDLPFPIDAEIHNEDLRLTYRYFDLRRPRFARNLRMRHIVTKATRDYLDGQGYIEVETPILSKSTPEGARDFLVPSRLTPGKFYALPQAPQQYKQLLMVGGVVKAINAKNFASLTIGQSDELTEIAKTFGAKGLAFIKVEDGEWKSPIVKFFSDAEKKALSSKLNIEEGDLILFAADKWETACEVIGRIRLRDPEYQK